MERVINAGRNLIAYCMGIPVAIAILQFQRNIEDMRRSGQEIWNISDSAGIVFKDNRWYVWIKQQVAEKKIEGLLYENLSVKVVLDTLHIALPALTSDNE